MRAKFKTLGFASVMMLAGITAGGGWMVSTSHVESTDNAYLRADISAVSSRVGGAVLSIRVKPNQAVAAGDLLLEIDPFDSQLRLDAAHADVMQAEAALAVNARMQVMRHGDRRLLASERRGLMARLDAAMAKENLAQLDLDSTRVLAARPGIVGDLIATVGSRVLPGQRLMSLVATDQIWVEANFKETQLHDLLPGQLATVRLDAMPGRVFAGQVESFAPAAGSEFALLPAENASGNFTRVVQRVSLRIVLEDAAINGTTLRPGLSAKVRINTAAQP